MNADLELRKNAMSQRDVINIAPSAASADKHPTLVDDPSDFESAPVSGGHVYRARWQLFLPTLAIAILYFAAWLVMLAAGRSDGALARIFVIVMAVGVPLLSAHAFLRFQTIRVHVLTNAVRYHPGWPKDLPVDMPLDLIAETEVRRGLAGRLFGGGTLVMVLTTGERVAVADLADPDGAKAEIDTMLDQRQ